MPEEQIAKNKIEILSVGFAFGNPNDADCFTHREDV